MCCMCITRTIQTVHTAEKSHEIKVSWRRTYIDKEIHFFLFLTLFRWIYRLYISPKKSQQITKIPLTQNLPGPDRASGPIRLTRNTRHRPNFMQFNRLCFGYFGMLTWISTVLVKWINMLFTSSRYRRKREKLVNRIAVVRLPTKWGLFQAYCYHSNLDGTEHVAFVKVGRAVWSPSCL